MIWCLHGAVGAASDWHDLLCVPILQRWTPQAVDLWQDWPRLDFKNWAEDWSASIAKLDPKPILLGYSLGGRLALHAMLSSPIWQAAIIVSAHTGLTHDSDRQQRLVQDQQWGQLLQTLPWESFLQQWNQQAVFNGRSNPNQPLPHPAMSRCFDQWSLSNQADLLPALAQNPCPLLWVVGERDAKFRAIGEQAVRSLPKATLAVAPDCGHRVPWEWDQFAAAITTFLTNHKI